MKAKTCFLILILIIGSLFVSFKLVNASILTETLRPNAAGDSTQCYPYPATDANWNCTDDVTSDSDTTYVASSSSDATTLSDLYNLPNTSIPSGSTIHNVTVFINCRSTHATYKATVNTFLKTNGQTYTGGSNDPSTTYTLYSTNYNTNPQSGSAWTIDEINALQIGVKLTSKKYSTFYFPGRCTQVYCEINYTVANAPSYSNVARTPSIVLGGENTTFSSYWTTPSGNMSVGLVEWNSTGPYTNNTYTFPAGTTAGWFNLSLATNSSGDCIIRWRLHANNTDAKWNSTDWATFYVWRYLPPVSEKNFGETSGWSRGGVYYSGEKEVIYVPYQDSSFSPWHLRIRAFDLEASAWTPPYDVVSSIPPGVSSVHWNDGHWAPSISVAPNGRLVYIYGYSSAFRYRVSVYSANSESNITKLITNWSEEKSFGDYYWAYAEPFLFDDRITVFGRGDMVGTEYEYKYMFYKLNQSVILWCDENDSTYTGWNVTGSAPYLQDGDADYVWKNAGGIKRIGYFTFGNFTYGGLIAVDSSIQAYLKIYATAAYSTVTVYLNPNGTDYNIGTVSSSGWNTINVTNYLNTLTKINDAKIYLYSNTLEPYFQNISRAYIEVNYEGFNNMTQLTTHGWYPSFWKNGTTILMTSQVNDTNVRFCYSPNKGDNWYLVNGTALSVPINMTLCQVLTSPFRTRTSTPILDENGKPIILVWYNEGGVFPTIQNGSQLRLAYYSTTLNASGTWTLGNITDEYGNQLYAQLTTTMFTDPWYKRPAIWCTTNLRTAKYVRIPSETLKFHCVWQDPTAEAENSMVSSLIIGGIDAYEIVDREQWTAVLGNITQGANWVLPSVNEAWATQFTAQKNSSVVSVQIFANCTLTYMDWRAAIYNSTFNLIGNTSWSNLVTGSTGYGWLMSAAFSPIIPIVQGQSYWVLFQTNYQGNRAYFCYNDAYTNKTFRCSLSTSAGFPSTISPIEYYNRTITITAMPSYMIVRGLGVDEYEMAFSNTGTNTSIANAPCGFFTFVMDESGLSMANFRTNNTGVWVNTTYLALSGFESWANFTATLNDTKVTVAWEIWANDSYNNWKNTGLQTFNTVLYVPLDLSFASTLAFSKLAEAGYNIFLSTTSTLQYVKDLLSSFILNLGYTHNPIWNLLSQSSFSIVTVLSQGFQWLLIREIIYGVLLSFTTTGQYVMDRLTNFIVNMLTTQTLVWNLLTQSTFNVISTFQSTVQWLLTSGIVYSVLLSFVTTAQYITLKLTDFILQFSIAYTSTWTSLLTSTINLVLNFGQSFQWLIEVIQSIPVHEFFVDLTLTLSQSYSTLVQWFANVNLNLQSNPSWITLLQSALAITLGLPYISIWTTLTQAAFSVLSQIAYSPSWILTVAQGIQYAVTLTLTQTMMWITEIITGVEVIDWFILFAFSCIMLIVVLCLLAVKHLES